MGGEEGDEMGRRGGGDVMVKRGEGCRGKGRSFFSAHQLEDVLSWVAWSGLSQHIIKLSTGV